MNLRPLTHTHYVMLCPQNGDRIVAIDTVTSLHPTYILNAPIISILVFIYSTTVPPVLKVAMKH